MKRAIAILLLLTVPALADSRTWTDSSGKYQSTAELADFHGGVAYLQKPDGHFAEVPLARLSPDDQDFIKSTVAPVDLIEGKVVGVTDGDTITVLDGTTPQKIRLEGIDAPESHQAFGAKAKNALSGLLSDKSVRVEWRERDKYGRILGHVFADGTWVNRKLVRDGWAWHYVEYSTSEVLAQAERDARKDKVGLWSDDDPIPPWDFRHKQPEVQQANANSALELPNRARAPPGESTRDITVYVTRTGSKYHHDGCRYLSKSKIAMPLSEAAAQYDPCSVCGASTLARRSASAGVTASPSAATTLPSAATRPTYGEPVTGYTATGIPIHTGPRGGRYHYSKSGKKVYEKKK